MNRGRKLVGWSRFLPNRVNPWTFCSPYVPPKDDDVVASVMMIVCTARVSRINHSVVSRRAGSPTTTPTSADSTTPIAIPRMRLMWWCRNR